MYGSAQLGLREALALKPEAVVLMPVDHPNVKANTVRALGAAMGAALGAYKGSRADKRRFAYAVVPRLKGRRGQPVVLSPGIAAAVAADRAASDLSDAIRRNARLVGYLDVADGGVVRNRNRRGPDSRPLPSSNPLRGPAAPPRCDVRPQSNSTQAASPKIHRRSPSRRARTSPGDLGSVRIAAFAALLLAAGASFDVASGR